MRWPASIKREVWTAAVGQLPGREGFRAGIREAKISSHDFPRFERLTLPLGPNQQVHVIQKKSLSNTAKVEWSVPPLAHAKEHCLLLGLSAILVLITHPGGEIVNCNLRREICCDNGLVPLVHVRIRWRGECVGSHQSNQKFEQRQVVNCVGVDEARLAGVETRTPLVVF